LYVYIKKNLVTLDDNWLHIGGLGIKLFNYFTISKTVSRDAIISERNKDKIFDIHFWLVPEVDLHNRVVYGWLDLLGRLGGVTISKHSFILKAAKKLFIARTRDKDLFKNDPR
jgi:hypothetical protein